MSALLAALLLAATPPAAPAPAPAPAQKAKELAAKKAWEELYLAFSSGDAAGVPVAQRRPVSAALLKGCEALLQEDTVMAYSLGERAAVYEPSASALKCLARSARKTDQRAASEAALRKGMELHPRDGGFGLELGKLLMEGQDTAGAGAGLGQVPRRSREAAEAKRLLQQARAQNLQQGAARTEAARLERELYGPPPSRSNAEPAPASGQPDVDLTVPALATGSELDKRTVDLTYRSGVDQDGMRIRKNSRFGIRYFNNDRDFGQRAEYEGKIAETLDEAYHFTRDLFGAARELPLDVVLYTAAEFRATFGRGTSRFVAGMYASNSMRINNGEELTREVKSTIVHEYVHAAVAEYCGGGRCEKHVPIWLNEGLAEYAQWRYMDRDEPDRDTLEQLKSAAKQGKLPTLRSLMNVRLVSTRNPRVSYAVCAIAAQELVRQGGSHKLLAFLREVGTGTLPFEEVLLDQYGKTLEELDKDVRNALP